MRRLVVETLCGACWSDQREVLASFSETLTVGDVRRDLDLCPDHVEDVHLPELRDWLINYGTKPAEPNGARPAKRDKTLADRDIQDGADEGLTTVPCDLCDFVTPALRFPRRSLGQHRLHVHGVHSSHHKHGPASRSKGKR
jgi:hypothetical protein